MFNHSQPEARHYTGKDYNDVGTLVVNIPQNEARFLQLTEKLIPGIENT